MITDKQMIESLYSKNESLRKEIKDLEIELTIRQQVNMMQNKVFEYQIDTLSNQNNLLAKLKKELIDISNTDTEISKVANKLLLLFEEDIRDN